MNTPAQLQTLLGEIVRDFPDAEFQWIPFPSCARQLDIQLDGREFELVYLGSGRAGVSENFDDTPPFIGQDEEFDTLEQAINRLKQLLDSAARGEKAVSPFAKKYNDSKTEPLVMHDKPISKS